MNEDFFITIIYKDKKVKFRVVNPMAPLSTLMTNIRHATNREGMLYFDFPSIDATGAPQDYFFSREDPMLHELRVMRPRIGKVEQTLADYDVKNGDTLYLVADPFPG